MKRKLFLSVVLGVTLTAAVADARTQLHLYGTVPVTGNNVLESAYRAAFDRCSAYAYPSYDRFGQYGGAYRSPAMSRCMSRMGFIQENGVTFAYPVRKAAYLPR